MARSVVLYKRRDIVEPLDLVRVRADLAADVRGSHVRLQFGVIEDNDAAARTLAVLLLMGNEIRPAEDRQLRREKAPRCRADGTDLQSVRLHVR
jgi:hypothetical protein